MFHKDNKIQQDSDGLLRRNCGREDVNKPEIEIDLSLLNENTPRHIFHRQFFPHEYFAPESFQRLQIHPSGRIVASYSNAELSVSPAQLINRKSNNPSAQDDDESDSDIETEVLGPEHFVPIAPGEQRELLPFKRPATEDREIEKHKRFKDDDGHRSSR